MLCWNSGLSFDVWSHVTLILLIRVVQFVYDIVSRCEIIKHLKSCIGSEYTHHRARDHCAAGLHFNNIGFVQKEHLWLAGMQWRH